MLTIFDQLAQIKAAGRTREKIALLKRFDSPTMRDTLFYGFSPTVAFGIGRIKLDPLASLIPTEPSTLEFLVLAQNLIERKIVSALATVAVTRHVMGYPPELRGLVIDLFAGKLAIGCDAEVINKALPGSIPVFGVQLAREFNPDQMQYPAFASEKLDGMRCLLFVTYAGVKLLTRTGKAIDSLPHIAAAFSRLPLGVYDGELLHQNGLFADTISICRKSEPVADSQHVRFHVFDYINLPEWDNPVSPAKDRFHRLGEIFSKYLSTNPESIAWVVVEHYVVKNSLDLSLLHDKFIAADFEGTMIQFDRPYNKKRTYDLMKLKNFLSTEATVGGYRDGTGKFKGMMGALEVIDTKTQVVFRCGSGFSVVERKLPKEFWLGKVIEIQYQELTKDNVPRFPTFLRLRDDLTNQENQWQFVS